LLCGYCEVSLTFENDVDLRYRDDTRMGAIELAIPKFRGPPSFRPPSSNAAQAPGA